MDRIKLIQAAIDATTNAYAPYSNFKVGAALLTESGEVFQGCNIENSTYGATICAERTAMVKAVSEGHRAFQAIAVVSVSNGNELTYPCGICRQFLFEFMPDAEVIVSDPACNYKVYKVSELLPHGFKL
ncbi:MAG: cytidine deaminase [Clostridia bacterium]